MLTIFATAKRFRGHNAVIQANAIQSWTLLSPECEIILFDDEEGTAEAAAKFGIRHVPAVERNEYGTPLVSSMFRIAQDVARYDLLCYTNADIIFMRDFWQAIGWVPKQPFLLLGQRWEVDLKESWDFRKPGWETRLRAYVTKSGRLGAPTALDYFVFRRGTYCDIPPFAIGRPAWDGWMVCRARSLGLPVIDATSAVMAVHQNHDYSHIPAGQAVSVWGPEADLNRKLASRREYFFPLRHVTHVLTPSGLKPALTRKHVWLRLKAVPYVVPWPYPLERMLKSLLKFTNRRLPG